MISNWVNIARALKGLYDLLFSQRRSTSIPVLSYGTVSGIASGNSRLDCTNLLLKDRG